MKKKYLSLIVVPHDNANVRNLRVPYPFVYAVIALVVLCALTLVIVFATYGRALVQARRADELATKNAQLTEQSAQIDSLKTELLRMHALGIQIKTMLGVGLSPEDSTLVANLTPLARSPALSGAYVAEEAAQEEQRLLLRAIPTVWPVKGYVTREFHIAGGEKQEQYHPGIDIAAGRHTPVRASAEGVVTASGWDDTYGYMVVIDHGFGMTTVYGHNSRNVVSVGDRVVRGQTIAFLGSTGKSTAPHLHFEVRKNGVSENPRKYLLDGAPGED
jgi:murein DD-endopeptidase MepM/ murein hydrolase activator NlpD